MVKRPSSSLPATVKLPALIEATATGRPVPAGGGGSWARKANTQASLVNMLATRMTPLIRPVGKGAPATIFMTTDCVGSVAVGCTTSRSLGTCQVCPLPSMITVS